VHRRMTRRVSLAARYPTAETLVPRVVGRSSAGPVFPSWRPLRTVVRRFRAIISLGRSVLNSSGDEQGLRKNEDSISGRTRAGDQREDTDQSK